MRKLIALLIVICCIVLMYYLPRVMLNPGKLVEAHQKLQDECTRCHQPFWGVSNDKCISCHKLSEIGKNDIMKNETPGAEGKILFHQQLSNAKCTSCHTDHKGVNPNITMIRFDHANLPQASIANCNKCHQKPSGNLHLHLNSSCNGCHNINGWKSSVTFDHELIQPEAKNNCTSCHERPADSFHQQLIKNCDLCHTTNKWKPSNFDHTPYFELDGKHNTECNTCHSEGNFSLYTCYGCHEHSENKIQKEHNEHGIYNFSNCSSCHRNGDEHDIRTNGNVKDAVNQKELNDVQKYLKEKSKDKKGEHGDEKEREED